MLKKTLSVILSLVMFFSLTGIALAGDEVNLYARGTEPTAEEYGLAPLYEKNGIIYLDEACTIEYESFLQQIIPYNVSNCSHTVTFADVFQKERDENLFSYSFSVVFLLFVAEIEKTVLSVYKEVKEMYSVLKADYENEDFEKYRTDTNSFLPILSERQKDIKQQYKIAEEKIERIRDFVEKYTALPPWEQCGVDYTWEECAEDFILDLPCEMWEVPLEDTIGFYDEFTELTKDFDGDFCSFLSDENQNIFYFLCAAGVAFNSIKELAAYEELPSFLEEVSGSYINGLNIRLQQLEYAIRNGYTEAINELRDIITEGLNEVIDRCDSRVEESMIEYSVEDAEESAAFAKLYKACEPDALNVTVAPTCATAGLNCRLGVCNACLSLIAFVDGENGREIKGVYPACDYLKSEPAVYKTLSYAAATNNTECFNCLKELEDVSDDYFETYSAAISENIEKIFEHFYNDFEADGLIIPATGIHSYENGVCIVCGAEEPTLPEEPTQPEEPQQPEEKEELSFFETIVEKILSSVKKILDWIKSLLF